MLIRAGSLNESLIVASWKFSCELRLETNTLLAEEVFHSSYTAWDWGNGEQNTLIGEVTKLTITHGNVKSSPIVRARFFVTPSALLRSADIVTAKLLSDRSLGKDRPVELVPEFVSNLAALIRRVLLGICNRVCNASYSIPDRCTIQNSFCLRSKTC